MKICLQETYFMISQNVLTLSIKAPFIRKCRNWVFVTLSKHGLKATWTIGKQKVNLNERQSSFLLITDCVWQGSVVEPFLFLLFINDISDFTTDDCSLNLLADDNISSIAACNISDLQMKLQTFVDNISQWNKNRLTVNASKCEMMILGTSARLKITSINDLNVMHEGNSLDLVKRLNIWYHT